MSEFLNFWQFSAIFWLVCHENCPRKLTRSEEQYSILHRDWCRKKWNGFRFWKLLLIRYLYEYLSFFKILSGYRICLILIDFTTVEASRFLLLIFHRIQISFIVKYCIFTHFQKNGSGDFYSYQISQKSIDSDSLLYFRVIMSFITIYF